VGELNQFDRKEVKRKCVGQQIINKFEARQLDWTE